MRGPAGALASSPAGPAPPRRREGNDCYYWKGRWWIAIEPRSPGGKNPTTARGGETPAEPAGGTPALR
ncbi:MAG TPA: hypothetical protein VGA84_02675 [Thermoanaerobaculia bacterium]